MLDLPYYFRQVAQRELVDLESQIILALPLVFVVSGLVEELRSVHRRQRVFLVLLVLLSLLLHQSLEKLLLPQLHLPRILTRVLGQLPYAVHESFEVLGVCFLKMLSELVLRLFVIRNAQFMDVGKWSYTGLGRRRGALGLSPESL